jgi:hypothetical protein
VEKKMNHSAQNIFKLLFILILLLPVIRPGEEIPARKFTAPAGVNFFCSPSADYRQIYGKSAFMPEIKIMRLVYRGLAVWGSIGLISDNGFIEEVDEKARIRKIMLGFGLGYVHRFSALLRLRGELGLAFISFKEDALEVIQKGSGLGWKVAANLDYFLSKRVFAMLTMAFSQAKDEAQTGKIDLGGFQAGAGLGFIF